MENMAVFLILIGLLLIVGYGLYHFIFALMYLAEVPVIIKIGIFMILLGFVVVILKLIWERIKGGNEDVDRKY